MAARTSSGVGDAPDSKEACECSIARKRETTSGVSALSGIDSGCRRVGDKSVSVGNESVVPLSSRRSAERRGSGDRTL